jgi:hypothetical protein
MNGLTRHREKLEEFRGDLIFLTDCHTIALQWFAMTVMIAAPGKAWFAMTVITNG